MVHVLHAAAGRRRALPAGLAAMLVLTALAVMTPSADADTLCGHDPDWGQQCAVYFTNPAGESAQFAVTIHYTGDQSRSVTVTGYGSPHLDGSSDRRGRWWRLMGKGPFDRHLYRYWRGCAMSNRGWVCSPWMWAGPGV